jgi:predicted TIM-barrel fold metal-dependent hydrolase
MRAIIDVDVHHTWANQTDVLDYMPREWRRVFTRKSSTPRPASRRTLHPPQLEYPLERATGLRVDAFPDTGGRPGSDYRLLRMQHLDKHAIDRALITWSYGMHPGIHQAEASVELCKASNDYMRERWLAQDDRLYGAAVVPTAVPAEAAKEVRRVAAEPHIAGVIVGANTLTKPMGHPVYHPIYEAAAEVGLPVITHVGTDIVNKSCWFAGGLPDTHMAFYALFEQPALHHVSSLITEGVFEKFRDLRVLVNECGFTWVPWLLWGLDARYDVLRIENPRIQRRPTEVFHEHIWLGTQPFAFETKSADVITLLESFGGMENKLCYASDYPHFDADLPGHVAARLPRAWRPKVMAENAARFFGWALDDVDQEQRSRKAERGEERSYVRAAAQ